jgi:hypothetical protein
MKLHCAIFTFTLHDPNNSYIKGQERITEFLGKSVKKIISVTQSSIGQGSAAITIFYEPKTQDTAGDEPAARVT